MNWDGIDGKSFKYSLAHIYEMQMWQDISRMRRENPDLFKLNIINNTNNIVGKAIIISTLEDKDNKFEDLWNEEKNTNALYRFFRPAMNKHVDDYGF